MPIRFADKTADSIPLHFVSPEALPDVLAGLPDVGQAWAKGHGFGAGPGECVALPDANGRIIAALVGTGSPAAQARGRFLTASAASRLPRGSYHVASGLDGPALEEAALGCSWKATALTDIASKMWPRRSWLRLII